MIGRVSLRFGLQAARLAAHGGRNAQSILNNFTTLHLPTHLFTLYAVGMLLRDCNLFTCFLYHYAPFPIRFSY